MATPATIRTALQSTFQTAGIAVHRTITEQVNDTVAVVIGFVLPREYQTFGTSTARKRKWECVSHLVTDVADVEAAQDRIDPYLASTGSQSVFALLTDDKTLGGVVETLKVGDPEPFDMESVSQLGKWGVTWTLELWGTGG